jgi:hypothetical protein
LQKKVEPGNVVLSYVGSDEVAFVPVLRRELAAHMRNKYLYLALSVVCLVIGLGAMFSGQSSRSDMFEGIFKGLAGVFFILYYILMLLGNEKADKTAAH